MSDDEVEWDAWEEHIDEQLNFHLSQLDDNSEYRKHYEEECRTERERCEKRYHEQHAEDEKSSASPGSIMVSKCTKRFKCANPDTKDKLFVGNQARCRFTKPQVTGLIDESGVVHYIRIECQGIGPTKHIHSVLSDSTKDLAKESTQKTDGGSNSTTTKKE